MEETQQQQLARIAMFEAQETELTNSIASLRQQLQSKCDAIIELSSSNKSLLATVAEQNRIAATISSLLVRTNVSVNDDDNFVST